MELLPAIDILDGKAVRLAKGDYDAVAVYNDDPVEQARAFERMGARWIHVVDLNGARSGIQENRDQVRRIVMETSLKVEVGGGVRSMEAIADLAEAGASRIVLGTALVKNPAFAREAIERYGDLLAAGIDARDGEVAIAGWEKGSGVSAEKLAREMADLGYRHMVYTDISRDGMQTGIDADAYARMAEVFGHPVIASGGVADLSDVERLSRISACIEGMIAGRAVYEGTLDVEAALERCAQTRG